MAYCIGLYIFAALLAAAHFLRDGSMVPAALCLLAPLAFLHRRRASLWLLQVLAYAAALLWCYTLWRLVEMRLALGRPWLLASAILGAVALVSLLAGLLLHCRVMRTRYPK
jgi:uncharacterized membrane protein HdeD (DUF308 family)